MKDRDRDLWTLGPGKFSTRSDYFENDYSSLVIHHLDRYTFEEDLKNDAEEVDENNNVLEVRKLEPNTNEKSQQLGLTIENMVSEESCTEDELYADKLINNNNNNNYWDLNEIKNMPLGDKVIDNHHQIKNHDPNINEKSFFVILVDELINAAVTKAENVTVISRNRNLSNDEKNIRESNRTTSIVIQDWDKQTPVECRNNFVNVSGALHRSASERVIRNARKQDEHTILKNVSNCDAVKNTKEKKKKKLSFNSIFHINKHKSKDPKNDEEAEKYDHFSHQLPVFKGGSLGKSKKYASALELSSQRSSLVKAEKPSFFRKLVTITDDSSNFLRRSLSFRDVRKKEKVPSREKISEIKKQEWRQSLQSLVESDTSVSYKDLSFINYDALDEFNYEETVSLRPGVRDRSFVGRSQSMREKGSPHLRRPVYARHTSVTPDYRSSLSSLQAFQDTSAVSLPALHHITQDNGELPSELPPDGSSSSTEHRRNRLASITYDDSRSDTNSLWSGSSSTGSAYTKLKRTNATRHKYRPSITLVELRPKETNVEQKIARESLNIEGESNPHQEGQEWRKFVGSIRRKVQRHAASSSSGDSGSAQSKSESGSRKNSLTKTDMLKKEKSEDKDKRNKIGEKQPLAKQKSIGLDGASKTDYFRALSFRDKTKSSVSVKHDDNLVVVAANNKGDNKGVRKSEKNKDIRPSLSFNRCKNSSSSSARSREGLTKHQDDFLKATMRIFLVVSPPVGKLQVRSRSLNHLDSLEMRQAVVSTDETALKDSKSEPDCTKPLLPPPPEAAVPAPAVATNPPHDAPPVTPHTDGYSAARKHMLSRSQKSSSECFSVNFEVGDESTWDNELFFPAQRGITLHDSLSKLCELRNIDLSACDARLQDKESHSESFILFTQDTASLVGRHVRITAKDTSNKRYYGSFHSNHSRKQSGNYRPRTSSFFSSSTEDQTVVSSTLSLHESDQSKKQIKQRLTAFFGNSKDTKYEALIEQLDRYTKQGIPQNVDYPQGQCESIDALYKLEDDWREIIKDYSELNDRQQQQQTALWELIKTEVAYIKTLKVVTDLFLGCLRDLQSKNLFKEIDTEKLFSNITEILGSNVIFWRNTLFPLVRDMRKYKRPACLENMLEGFSKLHDTFQPYFKYCAEQSRCQHYCRENLESEVFTAYLTWCESQKDCNRLRLMDILVQPMQRLTKYGLLLKAILKNTDEDVERESLQTMIKMVDDFVNSVNSSLKHRQDKERLKGIIARIESYDIVETKDDDIERILRREKSFTQLDLTRPMLDCPPERKRHLLLEGDLKLKDSGASKIEVHCFLLTDMLLICKPSTKKGGATMRVIRQPYLVDRLVIQELNRETPSLAVIYRNEFDMAVAAFILQNNDSKKIKGWREGIAKAQYLYSQAKQTIYMADESLDADYNLEYNLESDYHSLQLAPRSPMASSSRASRVSSLAHSHSGSVEMNDQSSLGSTKEQSRGVSIENENRTGSISSDEGLQPLPADAGAAKSPGSQKNSLKNRLFHKTPNTLSVQPVGSLGQSLPNLTLGSPNIGSGLSLNLHQNMLSVPGNKNGNHLLSPTHRGISYPPPSPTRGNLRRSLAISQSKNPPLIKTRQVCSASSVSSSQVPNSFDFDVPVIAGSSKSDEICDSFNRGQHRQAIKRTHRYHTAGIVDDIKKQDSKDASIRKRLSWNCTTQNQREPNEDQT